MAASSLAGPSPRSTQTSSRPHSNSSPLRPGATAQTDTSPTNTYNSITTTAPADSDSDTASPSNEWLRFSVEQLTPQFFFYKRGILSISKEAIKLGVIDDTAFAATVERVLDATEQVLAFDLGALLRSQIENPELAFQLNTREGVFVFRAQTVRDKARIISTIEEIVEQARTAQLQGSTAGLDGEGEEVSVRSADSNPLVGQFENIAKKVERYGSMCVNYETELVRLQETLQSKTALLQTAEQNWLQIGETNTTLFRLLAELQARNEDLMARLDRVTQSSHDAAAKVLAMQKKIDQKVDVLKEKKQLLGHIQRYVDNPGRSGVSRAAASLNSVGWSMMGGIAAGVLVAGMLLHYFILIFGGK
ncbi:uncharacterized protein EV422DRAFT_301242 [Fimicolochytrium jonesii]|uniref:uncharacterized protein n=1 Tax=Fimicolochytrium jonesii TaxID=1396493 RepID=UPI0022FE2F57|nr:uncharacterized protein EV422DRAFT_301242 [Fimicolochytrium jonesii]KAI8823960.1 hypothetical protein EV422DRAFT_301242 [Fimicolochytrium jonesii]